MFVEIRDLETGQVIQVANPVGKSLGRSGGPADIPIDDLAVSNEHARVYFNGGSWYLEDLGSANGVFVNGFHERQSHLMPGDRLTLGETSFKVEYELHPPKCYEDVLP